MTALAIILAVAGVALGLWVATTRDSGDYPDEWS